jgi:hypothetical protein
MSRKMSVMSDQESHLKQEAYAYDNFFEDEEFSEIEL